MEETPEKTRSHPLKTAKTLLLGAVLCIALDAPVSSAVGYPPEAAVRRPVWTQWCWKPRSVTSASWPALPIHIPTWPSSKAATTFTA